MKKLSVALAVYNEEQYIDQCLHSIKNIANEIVIVDGGSSDKTLEIAKKYNAKIIHTCNPPIFHINKQKALDACGNEWILQLDADEVVTPELAKEITLIVENDTEPSVGQKKKKIFDRHQQLVESRDGISRPKSGAINAYYVGRRNFFLGKPMTYAGMYPDGVIRLVKKDKAHFPMKSVHEQIEVEGRVGWLSGDLLHYSNPTLERYLIGANKYTNLLAKEIGKEKKNNYYLFIKYCIEKPITIFFTLFIRHKGILDGIHGFLFSLFSALHFPVGYWKYIKQILNPHV